MGGWASWRMGLARVLCHVHPFLLATPQELVFCTYPPPRKGGLLGQQRRGLAAAGWPQKNAGNAQVSTPDTRRQPSPFLPCINKTNTKLTTPARITRHIQIEQNKNKINNPALITRHIQIKQHHNNTKVSQNEK